MSFTAGSVTAKFEANINDLVSKLKIAEKSLQGLDSRSKQLQNSLKSLTNQKELLVAKMLKLAQAGQSNSNSYQAMQTKLEGLNGKIDVAKTKIGEFAESSVAKTNKLKDSFDKLQNTQIKNFADRVENAFAKIGEIMVKSGIAVGTFAGIIGGLAIKTTGDFQTQMLRTKAVARATDEQFNALKEQAIDLGAKTMFSAKEVAEAQFFLAAAGLKTDEIFQTTNATLNLAMAGQLELGRSAEITANIMSQFSMPAKDVGKAVDIMALAVNMSTQNMEELSDAMNYLGPTANAMGISLEEATALTIAMSNAGLKGSLGTRAFGTSLTRLAKPTDAMVGVMENLNLKFFDAKGNFIGIAGSVRQLEKGMKGLTQEQKMSALSTLFGAEAIQEWSILLEKGSGTLEGYTKELGNAEGSAKQMADTMQSGWAGATERMSSAWDNFLIKIGDSGLLDIATSGINYLTRLIDKLTKSPEFATFLNDMKENLKNLKTELKPVKDFIADIPENLKKMSDWWEENKSWLTPLGEFLGGVALGLGAIVLGLKAVALWGAFIALITSPFFLIYFVIALIIGLLVLLALNWDTVKAAAVRAWEGVKDAVWKALVDLGIWFVRAVSDINKKWSEIYDKAIEIWNNIKNFFTSIDLMQTGRDIIQGLINGVKSMIGAVGSVAGEVAGSLASGVNKAMGSFGGTALAKIGGIMGRAGGGYVQAGKLYEVGENNMAEMLMIGGKQFMIPGNNGEVLNQSQLMAGTSQGYTQNQTSNVVFNNNFTINGGNNTQAIVQQVVSVLTKQNNLARAGVGI